MNVEIESFYHSCWLILKSQNPRLHRQMNEIELNMAGLAYPKRVVKDKEGRIKGEEAPVEVL